MDVEKIDLFFIDKLNKIEYQFKPARDGFVEWFFLEVDRLCI